MMLLAFVACDLVSGSSTVSVEADPGKLELTEKKAKAAEPEPTPEPARAAGVACTDDERKRLHCELANGKQLAVCQTDGALSLRYGHPDVDLQIPKSGHGKDFALTQEKKSGDREQTVLVAKQKDYAYHVVTDRQEGQFDVVFEAYRGKQRLQTTQCTKLMGVDWTELPEL